MKITFYFVFDGGNRSPVYSRESFDGATIKMETDYDINVKLNERFNIVNYLRGMSLSDFKKCIIGVRSRKIDKKLLIDIIDFVSDCNYFYVYWIEHVFNKDKSIIKEVWLNLSDDNHE